MQRRTDSADANGQRMRLCFRQFDQRLEVCCGQISAADQKTRNPCHHRDRREVGDRIVRQCRIERRVDGVATEANQQRISVRRRLRHRGGGQVATRSGPVLDQDRLFQRSCHRFRNETRDCVCGAAGRCADHQFDRPCRKVFRTGRMHRRRKNDNGGEEKTSTTRLHLLWPFFVFAS